MCFPDENYDYGELSEDSFFVGAYDGGSCVGVAILRYAMFKYLYLCDLKVNADHRGKGIARAHKNKTKTSATGVHHACF